MAFQVMAIVVNEAWWLLRNWSSRKCCRHV